MATQKPAANKASDLSQTGSKPQTPGEVVPMTEASPNPPGEVNISETPVRTDHRDKTGSENVAQNPSTREGRLHTCVGESVAGGVADMDSMFNEADLQTAKIRLSRARNRARNEGEESRSKNTKPA